MNVIKRNGTEVLFEKNKIKQAINAANAEVEVSHRLTDIDVEEIVDATCFKCQQLLRAVEVEEIQDMVEDELIKRNFNKVARHYIRYRHTRELLRKSNTTDEKILSLISLQNEEVKQENSNKNPTIVSTQRDYMAGEVSKDLSRRLLLPRDVVDAHDKGIIHFHDMDYFAQHINNCCLVNLEDMLQNGTVISGTLIEKPHSFTTACNIATQIVAQVASSMYGGQTFTLSHLAPFVDVSRQRIRKNVVEEFKMTGITADEEKINAIAEKRVREEVRKGVQTIQYQINTLMTTNGQTPFVTVFMYLNEVDSTIKDDLAMIIEEVILQRIEGTKNEKGVWITPAFPKLIYVLEADNISEGTKYWELTKLAAKCTAKRLVPDYISEKKMKELKVSMYGSRDCYPAMGKCKLQLI